MTDSRPPEREYQQNVEQERVQDNPNWGADNQLPQEDKKEYWNDVTDENQESPEDQMKE